MIYNVITAFWAHPGQFGMVEQATVADADRVYYPVIAHQS